MRNFFLTLCVFLFGAVITFKRDYPYPPTGSIEEAVLNSSLRVFADPGNIPTTFTEYVKLIKPPVLVQPDDVQLQDQGPIQDVEALLALERAGVAASAQFEYFKVPESEYELKIIYESVGFFMRAFEEGGFEELEVAESAKALYEKLRQKPEVVEKALAEVAQ